MAASRPVNKNVNTGAVIRAKQGRLQIEPGVHKLLANYQTGGYKFRPMSGAAGTEKSDFTLRFLNALTKSTHSSV